MGFTTPCFIRKSTYKLRKKLDELGYRLFGAELNEDLCIFTEPEYGLYSVEFFSNIPHPDETDSIDCGTNEDLFMSIAALRDDIDENQWFTNGKEWFKCQYLKVGMHYQDKPEILFEKWHKATVEELIENFK
nr:hypothetical protein [Bacteroides intestinalis]